jgi:hypothetical protein
MLGVQLQGKQFRVHIELDLESRLKKKGRTIAENLLKKKSWFQFDFVPNGASVPEEHPTSGDFNKYSNIFFYRYKKLTKIAPQSLVDALSRTPVTFERMSPSFGVKSKPFYNRRYLCSRCITSQTL